MDKNNSKIKSDNRKALPKFFIIIVIAFFIGLLSSALLNWKGLTFKEIFNGLDLIFIAIAPYALCLLTFVLSLFSFHYYKQAKKLFLNWDGEDETSITAAETKINYVLLLTSINFILGFMLFSTFTFKNNNDLVPSLILIGVFIITIIVITVFQQKVIDLTRRINPEKQGSVYDMKFKDKWLASCDENEIRQIGIASFKSYTATTSICAILMLVTFILKDTFNLGLYPILVITIIWLVSTLAYFCEAIKNSK